jgi:peptidoglycan/xylan/chitin deacetylase (PgdA/CDA1 family)
VDIRALAKRAAHRSGALSALHRARNRDTLTVVTFHRVLGTGDARLAEADPRYTIDAALFEDCLRVLAREYAVVSVDDVLAARAGERALPSRSLLITLDDGWADNADYAGPVLARLGLPALLFVTGEILGRELPFWPEQIVAAARSGRLEARDLRRLASAAGAEPAAAAPPLGVARAVIGALTDLPVPERDGLLAEWPALTQGVLGPVWATPEQLRELRASGVAIGAHGQRHQPLAGHDDLARELEVPRDALAEVLGGEPPATMSFPHGSVDEAAVRTARGAGYGLLFTSETVLNVLDDGVPGTDVIGRVGIYAEDITRENGQLASELLLLWLIRRPHGVARAAPLA